MAKNFNSNDVLIEKVFTTSSLAQKVAEGKVFLVGAKVTTSLTNGTAYYVLKNNSTTKNLFIFNINVGCNVEAEVQFFHFDGDVSAYGANNAPLNANHGSIAVAETSLRSSNVSPGSIEVQSPIRRASSGALVEFIDGLLLIPPGHAFGVQAIVGGDGKVYANARFYEE